MRIDLVWEDESEKEVVRLLNRDWLLYGQLHVTNAHGVTRLDPTGITYRPPVEAGERRGYYDPMIGGERVVPPVPSTTTAVRRKVKR